MTSSNLVLAALGSVVVAFNVVMIVRGHMNQAFVVVSLSIGIFLLMMALMYTIDESNRRP